MSIADDKIIELAHKRFESSQSDDSEERAKRKADIRFLRLGEQWLDTVRRDRETPGAERPMLTINRLLQFRNQIVNEIRQNCPSIKARPTGEEANIKTADVINGYIRHIQEASDARMCYETAADNQVDTGLGWFRIITEYCDSESFDIDIKFQRIADSASVYPSAFYEPDGSDMKWCFVVEDMEKEEFERRWPKIDISTWDTNTSGGWVTKETVRVADYYTIETKKRTLCQLQDGSTGWKDELSEEGLQYIIKERSSDSITINVYKLGGDQIIERSTIPGEFIPVFPVLGLETWIEGKRYLQGLTRPSIDAQRLYNYMESANAETLALAPKAPYIAAAGQIEGFEQEWMLANKINISVLQYNPISDEGVQVPPPRRENPPGTNPGFEATMNRAAEDIKATMGIYDASLGNREGDQSGRAINSQMKQASVGNYHFSANLARSIKHAGRVIIGMIPTILDTPRVINLIAEDGEKKTAIVDPNAPESYNEVTGKDGEVTEVYNFNKGKYDVVSDVGPSFATKRQEAVESQMSMAQAFPPLMQYAGDIIVGNMDWPGAEEISKRLKAILPPEIKAVVDDGEKEGGEDPEAVQKMNEMADQMQHLSQALQEAQARIESDEEKLEIERFNAQTKRMEVEHKIAMESTGLYHKIAMDSLTQTLSEPNDGELEDMDDDDEDGIKSDEQEQQIEIPQQTAQPMPQPITPPEAQND